MSTTPDSPSTSNELQVLQDLYRDLVALEGAYRAQKICFYRPRTWSELGWSGVQDNFHRAGAATIRLVLGDNRSGKTVSGVCESIAHSLGYRPWLPESDPDRIVRLTNGQPIPVPNIGRVIAQDFNNGIKKTIFPKFQEWAPAGWYKIKYDTRGIPVEIIWKNGSVIHFMSDDQDDMVFEGAAYHWFWGDEPFSEEKYAGLMRGLIDYSGHGWMTLTPLSQFWIGEIIQSRAGDPDGEVVVFEFSIWDNCTENGGYLTRKAIEGFIKGLREDQRGARVGRQWLNFTGRVFPQWRPAEPYWVKPFDIPVHWPRIQLCDPHPRKPIAVMWIAISPDDQLIVYRDLFDEKLRTVDQVSDAIKKAENWKADQRDGRTVYRRTDESEDVLVRIIDTSSREEERTSGETIWSRFRDNGLLHMLAQKRNAEAGFDAIHTALELPYEHSRPGLIVFNTCGHVKNNFMKFVWDQWSTSKQRDLKGEKQDVRKVHDDFIDMIRYVFQAGITYRLLRRQLRDRHKQRPMSTTAAWR